MKFAHQEEAADEKWDHTETKQIWTEAASTCDLNNRPRLQQPNSSVGYNLFTSLPLGTWPSASQDFFFPPLHTVAYRVQMKSHFPTEVIHFPLTNWWAMMLCRAHALFNTFSSGIAGNIQLVWRDHGCFTSSTESLNLSMVFQTHPHLTLSAMSIKQRRLEAGEVFLLFENTLHY